MNIDHSEPQIVGGFPQNNHAQQMQLLDPSHPSYADSLGELGGLGSADIDVDEIIPTLSHGHAAMEVVGVVGEGQFLGAGADGAAAEVVDAATDNVLMDDGHSSDNNHSSLSNNNVNQNESEKDNLKIKITMRDGKTKVTTSSSSSGSSSKGVEGRRTSSSSSRSDKKSGSSSSGDKERSKERKSSSSASKSSSSSSSSGHHKSSSSSTSSSSSSSKRSSSGSKSGSSRDKDREKSSSHKSSSSSHSSSSKSPSSSSSTASRREKESVSQADKDKDTLSKVMGGAGGLSTLDKLGKIPKKAKTEEAAAAVPSAKKASISIEVRKDPENRPKTVKTFNSQFRNHGLVEDIPPPPSRKTLKKPESSTIAAGVTMTTTTANKSSLKRASPVKDTTSPVTEKRLKLDQIVAAASPTEEKPGGVKLIAPRAKRKYLLIRGPNESAFIIITCGAGGCLLEFCTCRRRGGSAQPVWTGGGGNSELWWCFVSNYISSMIVASLGLFVKCR